MKAFIAVVLMLSGVNALAFDITTNEPDPIVIEGVVEGTYIRGYGNNIDAIFSTPPDANNPYGTTRILLKYQPKNNQDQKDHYLSFYNSIEEHVGDISITKAESDTIQAAEKHKCPFKATVSRDFKELTLDLDCDLLD